MVIAACILLVKHDAAGLPLVLTVSRKTNAADIGLPGGKMDDTDLSLAHAAVRELLEETGYSLDPATLLQVLTADGDTGLDTITSCACTTFIVIDNMLDLVTSDVNATEKGVVAWLPPDSIVQPHCSFAAYNRRLLDTVSLQVGVRA